MLLNPDKFMELAEAAAYSEANVRFPFEMAAGEAKHIGGNVYSKEILRKGTIKYNGKEITFDGDFLKALKSNFEESAVDYVPLQFVTDQNAHSDDPRLFGGMVKKLKLDDEENPTKLSAEFELNEEARKAVENNPKVGVSIKAHPSYVDESASKVYGPTLLHVAMTNRPRVKQMDAWMPIAASEDDDTIDLTDGVFEYETSIDNTKGDDDMAGKEVEVKVEQPTFELTEDVIANIFNSEKGKELISLAVADATKEKDDEIERLSNSVQAVESKSYKQAVELAVESYAQKGVPKVARDLVENLLLTFGDDTDEDVVELSVTTGEGDNESTEEIKLSRWEAGLKILDEFEGFVDMTPESGSEEHELSDAPLTGEARKAAVAGLLGKARENRS